MNYFTSDNKRCLMLKLSASFRSNYILEDQARAVGVFQQT